MKILDCHVHYAKPLNPEDIISLMDSSKTDFFNIVLVPDYKYVNSICDGLVLKDTAKNRCYLFASLDVSSYFLKKNKLGSAFVKYVKRIKDIGIDGIKIIEGKPNIRKILSVPDFDSSNWEPFWSYMEEIQLPILMHLNDPEEFWNKNKIPSWAKKQGWYYDETFINNENQYSQMLNVLKKHPKLKIIFAHFFFMSKQLDRLSKILDTYQNVMIDLTPGLEMYINFQDNINKVKEFFNKYQNRIIYGTDIGARAVLSNTKLNQIENLERVDCVRSFLENDEFVIHADNNFFFSEKDLNLNGISLDENILNKIYYSNFINYVGSIKIINNKKVIKEARKLKKKIFVMSLFNKNVKRDYCHLNDAIKYFKKNKRN